METVERKGEKRSIYIQQVHEGIDDDKCRYLFFVSSLLPFLYGWDFGRCVCVEQIGRRFF